MYDYLVVGCGDRRPHIGGNFYSYDYEDTDISDFFANRAEFEKMADRIVYTGPIDRYFDYRYGHLS